MMDKVSSEWGLTVTLTKTKLMVDGACDEEDLRPIAKRPVIGQFPVLFNYCSHNLRMIVKASSGPAPPKKHKITNSTVEKWRKESNKVINTTVWLVYDNVLQFKKKAIFVKTFWSKVWRNLLTSSSSGILVLFFPRNKLLC